jgi:hypothetical protein
MLHIYEKGVTHKMTIYWCEHCLYETNNKTDYQKHTTRLKHLKNSQGLYYNHVTNLFEKSHNSKYVCFICDIEFNNRTTLWRHKKKCIKNKNNTKNTTIECNDEKNNELNDKTNDEPNYKELLLISLKQNKEMQEFIIKQSEQTQKAIEELIKYNKST